MRNCMYVCVLVWRGVHLNLDEFCVTGKMSQDSEGSEYPQIIHAQAGITG